MSTLALIGLGSNLGDRKATLDAALAALAATPGVSLRAASRYHETAPVGGPPGQGAFLNAAAALETMLDPSTLHDRLRAIEAEAGRVRTVRWGERTLDLDLLLYGMARIESSELRVPHPRMAFRRFVLAPLAQIAPAAVDPETLWTISDLLANLDRRPSYVAIDGGSHPEGPELARRVGEGLGVEALSRDVGLLNYKELRKHWMALLERFETGRREPDRWVVSDFWLFMEVDRWRPERDSALRRDVGPLKIRPTAGQIRIASALADAFSASSFPNVPTPTFAVQGPLGEAIVRAPCPVLRLQGPAADPEVAAAEILAACQASRA